MRYSAIATDYDGTLTSDGRIDERTFRSLKALSESGRKLILVTGRQLADMRQVFPRHEVFHLIVAENGALLYEPGSRREEMLCEPVPRAFVELLARHEVQVSAGRCIVGAQSADLETIRRAIQESGLDMQMVLNKDSLMVLPIGVTKATGLQRALSELKLAAEDVVAVGDAENDVDLFAACGRAVAVANALPAVKSRAHFVTAGGGGAGFCELAELLLSRDCLPGDAPVAAPSQTQS